MPDDHRAFRAAQSALGGEVGQRLHATGKHGQKVQMLRKQRTESVR
jgi:hypothetical protein